MIRRLRSADPTSRRAKRCRRSCRRCCRWRCPREGLRVAPVHCRRNDPRAAGTRGRLHLGVHLGVGEHAAHVLDEFAEGRIIRDHERGAAVLILCARVDAGVDERVDQHGDVARRRTQTLAAGGKVVQQRAPKAVHRDQVCAMVCKQPYEAQSVVEARYQEGCGKAVAVFDVGVGIGVQEKASHVDTTVQARDHERREARVGVGQVH
eukprot:283981-Pleurochrysis_carterae.AAC.3